MSLTAVYATGLVLLGGWGLFTTKPLWTAQRPWSRRRWHLAIAEMLLIAGCWMSAAALALGRFSGWTLLPIGVSYGLMIPLPCYFAVVDRVAWIHTVRNILFAVIAITCVAIGVGIVPVSVLGLH